MNATTLRRGALAGIAAGMMMAMFSMIALAARGDGFWTPVNAIAHTVWRNAPLDGRFSFGAALLGMMLHMGMSMMLGAAVAVAAQRGSETAPKTFMVGAGVAFAAWVTQLAVWPALDAKAADAVTPWVFAISHLVFAMVVSAVLLIGHRAAAARVPSLRQA